jgi:hypothetical protein
MDANDVTCVRNAVNAMKAEKKVVIGKAIKDILVKGGGGSSFSAAQLQTLQQYFV